jgi:hypothetical protein
MPTRIQMTRQRPWRAEHPDAVIVARPSKWGNPWPVGSTVFVEHARPAGIYVREFRVTPELAVALFRQAFTPDVPEIREELAGRDLACWCPLDQPCHGDVLLELANGGVS